MSKSQRYRARFTTRDLAKTLSGSHPIGPVNIASHAQRHGSKPLVYTSRTDLTDTTVGTGLTPPFPGKIVGVRGNVSTGSEPSGADLTFDVLLNGNSIFSGSLPTIYDGFQHGPIVYPRNTHWRLDDTLTIQMVADAGAVGPLEVHIMYRSDI